MERLQKEEIKEEVKPLIKLQPQDLQKDVQILEKLSNLYDVNTTLRMSADMPIVEAKDIFLAREAKNPFELKLESLARLVQENTYLALKEKKNSDEVSKNIDKLESVGIKAFVGWYRPKASEWKLGGITAIVPRGKDLYKGFKNAQMFQNLCLNTKGVPDYICYAFGALIVSYTIWGEFVGWGSLVSNWYATFQGKDIESSKEDSLDDYFKMKQDQLNHVKKYFDTIVSKLPPNEAPELQDVISQVEDMMQRLNTFDKKLLKDAVETVDNPIYDSNVQVLYDGSSLLLDSTVLVNSSKLLTDKTSSTSAQVLDSVEGMLQTKDVLFDDQAWLQFKDDFSATARDYKNRIELRYYNAAQERSKVINPPISRSGFTIQGRTIAGIDETRQTFSLGFDMLNAIMLTLVFFVLAVIVGFRGKRWYDTNITRRDLKQRKDAIVEGVSKQLGVKDAPKSMLETVVRESPEFLSRLHEYEAIQAIM